jgi:hypothetical protein
MRLAMRNLKERIRKSLIASLWRIVRVLGGGRRAAEKASKLDEENVGESRLVETSIGNRN